jgi:hypothetical protein
MHVQIICLLSIGAQSHGLENIYIFTDSPSMNAECHYVAICQGASCLYRRRTILAKQVKHIQLYNRELELGQGCAKMNE